MKKKKIISGLLFLVLLYLLFTIPIVEGTHADGHGYITHTLSTLPHRDQSDFSWVDPLSLFEGRSVPHPPICSNVFGTGACTPVCMPGDGLDRVARCEAGPGVTATQAALCDGVTGTATQGFVSACENVLIQEGNPDEWWHPCRYVPSQCVTGSATSSGTVTMSTR